MATKKIINVEPEAPSAEQALYDVAFEDGTHQTMTEAEIITETNLEAQEAVAEPAQEPVVDSVQEVVLSSVEAPVEANIVPVVAESTVADIVAEAVPLTTEQEGYAMYFLGGDLGQNPYMDITEEYFAWEKGWNNAYNEDHLVK